MPITKENENFLCCTVGKAEDERSCLKLQHFNQDQITHGIVVLSVNPKSMGHWGCFPPPSVKLDPDI